MITKQDQLDILNKRFESTRDRLDEIIKDIDLAEPGMDYENNVLALMAFALDLVNLLNSKHSEAEQILRMWITFNDTMEKNPHVAEQWNTLLSTLALVS